MDKESDLGGDINPDTVGDVSGDIGSDFGGDLSNDTGVDLNGDNNQNLSDGTDTDTGLDEPIGDDLNACNVIQADNEITEEQPHETSALSNILTAGAGGVHSPSDLAQVAAELRAHSGTEDVYAQGLQAIWNMGVVGSGEMMDSTIRQYGRGPVANLENIQINQAIADVASKPLNEPLREQDYYDESGVKITDEKPHE